MSNSSQINRSDLRNETSELDETLEIVENGTNNHEDESDTDDDEPMSWEQSKQPPPAARTKFEVPKFLLKKPSPVEWRPIESKSDPQKKLGIQMICPNICHFFLQDECIEGDNCYNSHKFPTDSEVMEALRASDFQHAAKLFHIIIARCGKLLRQYFHTFVNFFVEQNLKDDLIETIFICGREPDKEKQFKFFKHLICALIQTGYTYTTAMEAIYWKLLDCQSDVIDTLLNMNLVDGACVDDFLNVFASLNESHYPFYWNIIDRLMYLCTQSEAVLPRDQLDNFVRLIYNILRSKARNKYMGNKQLNYYDSYFRLYNNVRNSNHLNWSLQTKLVLLRRMFYKKLEFNFL